MKILKEHEMLFVGIRRLRVPGTGTVHISFGRPTVPDVSAVGGQANVCRGLLIHQAVEVLPASWL